MFYLLGAVGFVLVYMHFKRGTKFAYEIAKDDVISLWIDNSTFCSRIGNACNPLSSGRKGEWVDRKVTRVMDDYSLEVRAWTRIGGREPRSPCAIGDGQLRQHASHQEHGIHSQKVSHVRR
jgi:hypothetical protein